MKVSARNVLPATIKTVTPGSVDSEVVMELAPGIQVVSIITKSSAERLRLTPGAKVYAMNCGVCHGDFDSKPAILEKSLYPPPPNLILHPLDDPEWHVYYVIRTGVRYTGMPSWDRALTDPDVWKVTAFLTRINKLPPAVQEYWKKTSGVAPPAGESEGHEHK